MVSGNLLPEIKALADTSPTLPAARQALPPPNSLAERKRVEAAELRMKFRIAGADSTVAKPVKMGTLAHVLKRLGSGARTPLAGFAVGAKQGGGTGGRTGRI